MRLVVKLLYGCGLRSTEPLSLRLRDVLLADSKLIIRQAKGAKDRVVPLPCALIPEIRAQISFAEIIWQRDVAARVPIQLPGQLAKKYPLHLHQLQKLLPNRLNSQQKNRMKYTMPHLWQSKKLILIASLQ